MHISPIYYAFEDLFHTLMDITFFVLSMWMFRVVRGTELNVHTRWLTLSIIGNICVLLYRLTFEFYRAWPNPLRTVMYLSGRFFLDAANIIGIFSTLILIRIFLELLKQRQAGAIGAAGTPGVWPPAPQ